MKNRFTPRNVGVDPLPKRPKIRGETLAEMRVQLVVLVPKPIGLAVRNVARTAERSLSDLFSEITRYYLDVHHPDWETQLCSAPPTP